MKQNRQMKEDNLKTLILSSTYRSSPNIAWVKYWGKFDQANIIPYNDNIGLTLNSEDINTLTTITFSKGISDSEDSKNEGVLILNGKKEELGSRIRNILKRVKQMVWERKYCQKIPEKEWAQYCFRIESRNSFPTASGLASSASGLACLVAALNGLFDDIFTRE